MKIKARIYGMHEVTIVGFVTVCTYEIKAVYIDKNGKMGSCYLEYVEVGDIEYISAK